MCPVVYHCVPPFSVTEVREGLNTEQCAQVESCVAAVALREAAIKDCSRYNELDSDLRPPESQMVGLTNENFEDYGQMITDLGGADICYAGPGWTGHFGFIDPDAPEVPMDLEEFKQLGPTKVTLSPFTLAQNSLHGSFGASGDIAAVPPKSATIGPAQFLEAKYTINSYGIGIHGTTTSWQRLTARLCLFGPVTPLVPDSIVQLRKPGTGEARVSESIARKIEVDWNQGY